MRKLKAFCVPAVFVEDVINEFNERAADFGITKESDVVSVSVRPIERDVKVVRSGNETTKATIEVTIVCWSDE